MITGLPSAIPILGQIIFVVGSILWIVLSIMGIVSAAKGEQKELPILGPFAKKLNL